MSIGSLAAGEEHGSVKLHFDFDEGAVGFDADGGGDFVGVVGEGGEGEKN